MFSLVDLCVTTYNALDVFRFECSRPLKALDERNQGVICFILVMSVSSVVEF